MGFEEFYQFVKGLLITILLGFQEFKQVIKGLIGNILWD